VLASPPAVSLTYGPESMIFFPVSCEVRDEECGILSFDATRDGQHGLLQSLKQINGKTCGARLRPIPRCSAESCAERIEQRKDHIGAEIRSKFLKIKSRTTGNFYHWLGSGSPDAEIIFKFTSLRTITGFRSRE